MYTLNPLKNFKKELLRNKEAVSKELCESNPRLDLDYDVVFIMVTICTQACSS